MNQFNDISRAFLQFEEIAASILRIQSELKRSVEPLIDTAAQVEAFLAPVLKQYEDFSKFVRGLEKSRKDTHNTLMKAGWWLTPSMMNLPNSWITEAVKKYQKGHKRAIFDLYRKVYQNEGCSGLEAVVNGWRGSPLFSPWTNHYQHALKAHKLKQYKLSLPVLLIVAEGVASKFCTKEKIRVGRSDGKQKISKAIHEHYKRSGNALFSSLNLLEVALNETIYKDTEKLKDSLRRNILNRHAIMHGLKPNYGTMKTSLQSFMLLDVLSELR